MDLTRSAIHAFANQASKLRPVFSGTAYQTLGKRMQYRVNDFMDTTKFLYRLATILSVEGSVGILPLHEPDGVTIRGYYPISLNGAEVLNVNGTHFIRFRFGDGSRAAIELDRFGILTTHQYENDFFGSGSSPLDPTLSLMHSNNQALLHAVNTGADIKFIAGVKQALHDDDLKKLRDSFAESNLTSSNQSGLMLYDSRIDGLKQIDHRSYTVDKEQQEFIRTNVYNYFGVNEDILQNKFTEESWNAFYEGKIEPFATQLSLVLTNMTFTPNEIAYGNEITLTSNRLQHLSNRTKLDLVALVDRGIMSRNDLREVWNLPSVEGGDELVIRKEYMEAGEVNAGQTES